MTLALFLKLTFHKHGCFILSLSSSLDRVSDLVSTYLLTLLLIVECFVLAMKSIILLNKNSITVTIYSSSRVHCVTDHLLILHGKFAHYTSRT